jgi:hypothetical protein
VIHKPLAVKSLAKNDNRNFFVDLIANNVGKIREHHSFEETRIRELSFGMSSVLMVIWCCASPVKSSKTEYVLLTTEEKTSDFATA